MATGPFAIPIFAEHSWARVAHHELLARHSQQLVLDCPYANREEFLSAVDRLIAETEQAHARFALAA